MIDEYDVEIKRIRKEHAKRGFETGDEVFDKINPSKTLKEYYESEAEGFRVYILLETKEENIATGILRIRFYFEEGIREDIPGLKGNLAIYLSRIGVHKRKKEQRLGSMLREYFFYICRSEARRLRKPVWIYLKTRNRPEMIRFFKPMGVRVVSKYDDPEWGESVVMATILNPKQ